METLLPRVKPILVNYPQRSAEWHQARLGNVTGSEAKKCLYDISDSAKGAAIRALLGVKVLSAKLKESQEFLKLWNMPALKLFELAEMEPPEPGPRIQYRRMKVAERFTGLKADPEPFITYDMKWGITNESLALSKYQLLTGNPITEAPFMLHPDLRAGASPDGFVTDHLTGLAGVIECKCLRSHNQLYDIMAIQEVPEEYMTQIHMEIWISGTDFCDFIGYDSRLPNGLDLFVKRVERDDKYINEVLEPEVKRFLDDCNRDQNYFYVLLRKELERRKKEGIIIMPKFEELLDVAS